MVNKKDIRLAATVAVAVMAAGWLMHQFRDVGFVAEARSGYGN